MPTHLKQVHLEVFPEFPQAGALDRVDLGISASQKRDDFEADTYLCEMGTSDREYLLPNVAHLLERKDDAEQLVRLADLPLGWLHRSVLIFASSGGCGRRRETLSGVVLRDDPFGPVDEERNR